MLKKKTPSTIELFYSVFSVETQVSVCEQLPVSVSDHVFFIYSFWDMKRFESFKNIFRTVITQLVNDNSLIFTFDWCFWCLFAADIS